MKDRVRFTDDYMVHFESENGDRSIRFRVYQVQDGEYLAGPKKGKKVMLYVINMGPDPVDEDEFDESMTKEHIQGTYCWRGVWEGRLYFLHEEYWSEDLKELSDLFSAHIEPWCKNYIRKFYPHADE